MKKKIISLLLAVVMIAGMLPLSAITAFAEVTDTAVPFLNWSETEKKLYEDSVTDYELITSNSLTVDSSKLYSGWYVVDDNITVTEFRIVVEGDVNLILCDGAKLTASKGISVPSGNSITIYGQENGTGELIATADSSFYAGIGGDNGVVNGIITNNGNSGSVTVNGGKIRAQGGFASAGIGGGLYGVCGKVTVNGGDVTAIGGYKCAGITNGSGADKGTNLSISDNIPIIAGDAENNMTLISLDDYKDNINIVEGENAQKYVRICDCRHEGKAPTCTESGYLDYYEYDGKYYSDSKPMQEITDINTWLYTACENGGGMIAPIGGEHKWVCNGDRTYHICQKCGIKENHTLSDTGECTVCGWGDKYIVRSLNGSKVVQDKFDIPANATKITANTKALNQGFYVVSEDVTVNDNVIVNGTTQNPTNIILMDGCTLTVSGSIKLYENNALNIYGQNSDTGTLITEHIGGDTDHVNCGALTVYGGTVNANAQHSRSAAIGGSMLGRGGAVYIYGGIVNATCSSGGAGIGGGVGGNGGDVYIYGGTVTAASEHAMAIGRGGDGTSDGKLTLGDYAVKTEKPYTPDNNRGQIVEIHFHNADTLTQIDNETHKCSFCGATENHTFNGYECKCGQNAKYIERTLNGSKVVESEAEIPDGAVIITDNASVLDSGFYVVSEDVTVDFLAVDGINSSPTNIILMDGCTLTVSYEFRLFENRVLNIYGQKSNTGTLSVSHIGGDGDNKKCGTLTVYGGTVNATSNENGAAIGGTYAGDGGTITVYGGTINATSNSGAAAIGGGLNGGNGGDVYIYGGVVNAASQNGGAAIGKGNRGYSDGKLILGDYAVKTVEPYGEMMGEAVHIHFHNDETLSPISISEHLCSICGKAEIHTYVNGKCICGAQGYAVTFDLQGHGNEPVPTQFIYWDGKVTKPVINPTETGYIFGGWYKEAQCINAWDFDNDTVTADTTLYARWIYYCTLSLLPTGGSGGTKQVIACYGEALPAVTIPTMNGVVFDGYYDINGVKYYNADGTCAKSWDKNIAADVLVAYWTSVSPHTHTFADTYTYDENHHWHECTCEDEDCAGFVSGFGAHTFDEGVKDGIVTTYTCTGCGYQKTVLMCDINKDGNVDANDLILVQIALLCGSDYYDALDCNGDGSFDLRDMVRLKKYCALAVSLNTKQPNQAEQPSPEVANLPDKSVKY